MAQFINHERDKELTPSNSFSSFISLFTILVKIFNVITVIKNAIVILQ